MKKNSVPMYFGWGKRKYTIIDVQGQEWIPCYSAKQLERELQTQLCGQKLCAVLADLNGYLEARRRDKDIIDLSFIGGPTVFVFERTVFQVCVEVSGILRYRCFPVWEMVVKQAYGYPPEDMVFSERYYIDIGENDLSVRFRNQTAIGIIVSETPDDSYGFASSYFNRELLNEAAEKRELPSEVSILFDGFRIRIEGDIIENYRIFLESTHRE